MKLLYYYFPVKYFGNFFLIIYFWALLAYIYAGKSRRIACKK